VAEKKGENPRENPSREPLVVVPTVKGSRKAPCGFLVGKKTRLKKFVWGDREFWWFQVEVKKLNKKPLETRLGKDNPPLRKEKLTIKCLGIGPKPKSTNQGKKNPRRFGGVLPDYTQQSTTLNNKNVGKSVKRKEKKNKRKNGNPLWLGAPVFWGGTPGATEP